MRVVVFEAEDWEREACLRLSPPHVVDCLAEPLTLANAPAHAEAEAIATFIKSDLGAATLRHLPRLQLIATRSTGYEHIDLDYCRAEGVTVCNVPGYGDHTVAEHAFALLLAVSRKLVQAADRTRRGDFSQDGLRGFDLYGKTLGVIGTGRIGRRAAEIGLGFGMRVLGFDLRADPGLEAKGVRYVALDDLLAQADVVTLHVPGGAATRNLISDSQFARMKPGAVLINTARGGVVDAEALVRALASGQLAGAGLDVLSEEGALREEAEIFRARTQLPVDRLRSLLADHALLRFPSVVMTPHIAYDTHEAVGRILDTTVANIEAFAAGRPCNVVAGPA